MLDRSEGMYAELVEDEAFRFISKCPQPMYTYPTNGLPVTSEVSKKMETTFLAALQKA